MVEVEKIGYSIKGKESVLLEAPKEIKALGLAFKDGIDMHLEGKKVKISCGKRWIDIEFDFKDKNNPVININSSSEEHFSLVFKQGLKVNFKQLD
jgi:hypothetical protein